MKPETISEKTHLLVVDDDERLALLLHRFLRSEGYWVTCCHDTEAAMQLMQYMRFHLLVLDVRLPGKSGLDITRQLRSTNDPMPILLLTAENHVDSRLQGLHAGADDYVTKPFDTRELSARIQAILRRSGDIHQTVRQRLVFGEYIYHVDQQRLMCGAQHVRLTGREQAVLHTLALHANTVISRSDLALQMDISGSERSVDALVVRLRRKLEPEAERPQFLQTIHGKGYVLRPEKIQEY